MATAGGHHVHQGIDAEQLDLAADEVADPGLGDAEELRRPCLGETLVGDDRPDERHQRQSYLDREVIREQYGLEGEAVRLIGWNIPAGGGTRVREIAAALLDRGRLVHEAQGSRAPSVREVFVAARAPMQLEALRP